MFQMTLLIHILMFHVFVPFVDCPSHVSFHGFTEGNSLTGKIPTEIGALSSLESFDLSKLFEGHCQYIF